MLETILEWDRETFIYLNNLGIERYDAFWVTVTDFINWTPLFLLLMGIIFWKYPKREAILVMGTLLLMILFVVTLTDLTKNAVARLRPNNTEEISTLIRILKTPTTYSFFSGHSSSSFSIATILVLFLRHRFRWCWLMYLWALLMVASRVFVGVHYPVDIIVGGLVGVLSAFFFYILYVRLIVPTLGLSRP